MSLSADKLLSRVNPNLAGPSFLSRDRARPDAEGRRSSATPLPPLLAPHGVERTGTSPVGTPRLASALIAPAVGAGALSGYESAAAPDRESPPRCGSIDESDDDSAFEDAASSICSSLDESDDILLSDSPLDVDAGIAAEVRELLWNVQSELPMGAVEQLDACIKLKLPLSNLSAQARDALQLTHAEHIVVNLDFELGLRRNSPQPRLSVSRDIDFVAAGEDARSPERTVASYRDSQSHLVPITLLLSQSLSKVLAERWRQSRDTLLPALYQRAALRLEDAGTCCMLCDTSLVHGGLTPSICDAPLCAYQLDSLGLGANLELLRAQPEVASFLFVCAMAAASAAETRPLSFPPLHVLPRDDAYEPIKPTQMVDVLGKLPDLKSLPSSAIGIAHALRQADPLLPKVVTWILATNRAHLVHVESSPAKEQLQATLQFDIDTSTRAHAAAFAAQKKKHGSFYAFHGSASSNWHNILRNNLLNVSKSELMTTGAVYGDGIYLAGNARTSLTYATRSIFHRFNFWTSPEDVTRSALWENGIFAGVPSCMALCEVANDPTIIKTNSDIFVVADERNVMLRQLFIDVPSTKGDGTPISATAENLAPRKYRNETTFDGDPLDSIPKERFLATSDGYAWDIREVVQWVQAKDGVFINTYSNRMFAPEDVQAILEHKSGEGLPLKELIACTRALRQKIQGATLRQLRKCGDVCVKDQSSNFSPSMRAIDKLKAYLQTVSAEEQEALRRVPFETRDSVNNRPVSDTVMHALDSAVSEAECIHRFGDFLSQVA